MLVTVVRLGRWSVLIVGITGQRWIYFIFKYFAHRDEGSLVVFSDYQTPRLPVGVRQLRPAAVVKVIPKLVLWHK